MLSPKIKIIPAIDIIDGKCVRLVQGDYSQKSTYILSPLDMAKQYEEIGITHLHLVDLDGAKSGTIKNLNILEDIAKYTQLKIDFGGGIKTKQDVECVFNAGACWATIGSLAVKNKSLWTELIQQFGAEKMMLGADVLNEKIAVSAWAEKTNIALKDFINDNIALGIKYIFITDISKDGLLQGPAIDLYKNICASFSTTKIIASGGVHCAEDILALQDAGCSGVIIGKAIYENKISLEQIKSFL